MRGGPARRGFLPVAERFVPLRPVLPKIVAAATEQAPDLAPSELLHAGDFLVLHHRGGIPVAVWTAGSPR